MCLGLCVLTVRHVPPAIRHFAQLARTFLLNKIDSEGVPVQRRCPEVRFEEVAVRAFAAD